MIFKILLTLSLLLTAGTSAYMSVFGLISVFSTYAVVVGCMGAGMELGKILIVVYVHRRWKIMRLTHKFYYVLVVLALLSITSAEIIGFLSQAHSTTGQKVDVSATQLSALKSERENLQHELDVLEETLSALPKGYVSKRLNARKDAGYYEIRKRLNTIEGEIGALGETRILSELEAGPIFAVAGVFGVDSNLAILIFILALVFVVEPLSVGLTVAVSTVWYKPPVVTEPPEPKVGKMSKSHVERIEQKTQKPGDVASPEKITRAIKDHRNP